jgi:hypothetical protein
MDQPRLIPCTEHGSSPYCYIQQNGTHINESKCTCRRSSVYYSTCCPVDLHKIAARHQQERKGHH